MRRSLSVLIAALGLVSCKSETGIGGNSTTDVFRQGAFAAVDILWVIDNSGSMASKQAQLADGIQGFVEELDRSGADYQMGVTTTSFEPDDPYRGGLVGQPPIITDEDPVVEYFQQRAQVGTDGSDKERGLAAAAEAVGPTLAATRNAGFVRDQSQLVVVFVSDEEDCSDLGLLDGEPATACYHQVDALPEPAYFVDKLAEAKGGDRTKVTVGAIIAQRPRDCGGNAWASRRYALSALLTDGSVGDLCASDWTEVLIELGLNATGIQTSFQLSYAADPATIVVLVDEDRVYEDEVSGYTYDANAWRIQFHGRGVPPPGAEITVTYDIVPTPGAEPPG